MSKSRLLTVNFGTGKTGLSTVGYTIYNRGGGTVTSRTTSGVDELGTGTGIYFVTVTIDDDFDGIVLWDTGDGSVRYGLEPTFGQLNSIQNETDHIRMIWNSMRNQGNSIDKILSGINKKEPLKIPEYSKELKSIASALDKINNKEYPSLRAISDALKVMIPKIDIPAPVVNIPKTEIPNYVPHLAKFNILLEKLLTEVSQIPKQHKDYSNDLLGLAQKFESLVNKLEGKLEYKISGTAKSSEVNSIINNLLQVIDKMKKEVNESIVDNTKLDKFVKDMIIAQQATKMIENNSANRSNTAALRMALGIK